MSRSISRRGVLIGTASASLTMAAEPLLPAFANDIPSLAPSDRLTKRVTDFLALLDKPKRKLARFTWDGPEWNRWNYFGGGGFIKPGLRLEQMTDAERDATWAILSQVLSPSGLEKARNVMLLQDILAAAGNGRGQRSSKRFSIAIFGEPASTGAWGIRLEGHHLSLSFSVRDNRIVSVTPAAFAALPNRVMSGPHRGLNTLLGEEKLARQLQADLTPELKSRALVRDRHLFNILSSAGRERDNTEKVGIAAADMSEGQRDLLWQLIETYAVEPYAGDMATAQKTRIKAGDPSAVHFGWYGPNTEERSFGYRVIGDEFVIELGCIDGQAQHLHPIYHDLRNTLGRAA